MKTINCKICHSIKNENYFSSIEKNKTYGRCKLCDWKLRNNDKYSNVLKDVPYIDNIVESILCNDMTILNDLSERYSITITELIDLLRILNIGNKKYRVRTMCDNCNKQFLVTPTVYIKNKNHFCSKICYHIYRNEHLKKSKDSPYYNRITTYCSNCNKQIDVIPYYFHNKNMFGDNHNFCSHKCYSEFRSRYYVGDKHISPIYTEEMRNKFSLISAERCKNLTRLNTKPQQIVDSILDSFGYKYEREYVIGHYSVDNYLIGRNLIIEVMGDFWHVNPNKYQVEPTLSLQQRMIIRDRKKYNLLNKDYNILYLWEKDIITNPELCSNLVKTFVNNNGVLSNYHSFNYHLSNNAVQINDCTIKPYFE